MWVNVYARAGLVLGAAVLLSLGGCRSAQTDRIRVLEAEKADAERRNKDLQHQQAELRANVIKAEGDAAAEQARLEALEARLELLKTQPASEPESGRRIDVDALRRAFAGSSAVVNEREDGGATIVLASDITFRAGRADLNQKAESTLSLVARALKVTEGFNQVRIEGHTDSDPIKRSGWKSNEDLSLARASTVRKYLVSHGIEETMLDVKGHGSSAPTASNQTSAGKARNRRVEIVLIAKK